MLQSWLVLALIILGVLGNLVVLFLWRRSCLSGALLARNLAIASLMALMLAAGFALGVFTQIWVASPGSLLGPAAIVSGALFLVLSSAGVATLIISRHRDSHAAT